jgi:hypothetical protein
MILEGFNCWGMENNLTIRGLLDIWMSDGSNVFFLSQAKLKKDGTGWLWWKLGMPNMTVNDCDGKGKV